MKKERRGQVSVEYMIVLGFATFAITGIIGIAFYYINSTNDQMTSSHIENFGKTIINNAESIYFAGTPSKITVNPYLPKGVTDIDIVLDAQDNSYNLIISYSTSTGANVIGFKSNVPLVVKGDAISTYEGIKNIIIQFGTGADEEKIDIIEDN